MTPIHTVGLEEGRTTLPSLAARANAGEPSLLTRHGKPYAEIVPPGTLAAARPKPSFVALRGIAPGAWGRDVGRTVGELRDEWS